jgi:predicted amidohydrolase
MDRLQSVCCDRVHAVSSAAKENAMRIVKAAAVQLSPVLYSREGTVDKVVRKIHELGQEGVQFATFPETVVPYYPYFSFVQSPYQIIGGREHLKLLDQAVTVPSQATNAISEACKEGGVVVSMVSTNVTAEPYTTPSFFLMPTAR